MALLLHLAKLTSSLVALLVLGRERPLVALAGALWLYLSAFAFTHDVAHGALKLPRRLNEWVLALAALFMGVSGHAMRRLHLRHHARPLGADDVEGRGATLPFFGALGIGPRNAAEYRVEAFHGANARERRWMTAEHSAALALALAALLGGAVAGGAWVVVNVTMALTASLWASHLPHRPPPALVGLAKKLAWTKSAVVLSFLFHEEHHARPKVACHNLAAASATR